MTTQPNDGSTPRGAPRGPGTTGAGGPPAQGLNIDVRRGQGGVVEIRVSGELDMVGAPVLRGRLTEELANCRALVLDLADVEFLGTAGLSILLEADTLAQRRDIRWGIVATRHAVTHPLRAVGLGDVLPVHPSVAIATTAVTGETAGDDTE